MDWEDFQNLAKTLTRRPGNREVAIVFYGMLVLGLFHIVLVMWLFNLLEPTDPHWLLLALLYAPLEVLLFVSATIRTK